MATGKAASDQGLLRYSVLTTAQREDGRTTRTQHDPHVVLLPHAMVVR